MGIGYTVDTPIRVASLGINSVISLVDDHLLEKMRTFYSPRFNIPYEPIPMNAEDGRAKRITAYLDMVKEAVDSQLETMRKQPFFSQSNKDLYFDMLPGSSELKKRYQMLAEMPPGADRCIAEEVLTNDMQPGSIDVNIMVKLDNPNRGIDGKWLPKEFNDALAALRGFINSSVESAVVFSAGINNALFNYLTNFEEFYYNDNTKLKKRAPGKPGWLRVVSRTGGDLSEPHASCRPVHGRRRRSGIFRPRF